MHASRTCIAGLAAISAFASSAAAQSITFIGSGRAEAISSDGTTVVGQDNSGWLWTAAGGVLPIGGSEVRGVSSDGTVAFGSDGSSPTTGAFWTALSGWVSIGGLPGVINGCPDLSNPYAMSAGGNDPVAVGLGWDGCSAFAFKYSSAGFEQLPQDGPFSSRANGVSADGSTIGGWDEFTNGARRAAIWFPDGSEEIILEGITPLNVEGRGEVFGFSHDGTIAVGEEGGASAFRWTADAGAQQLGSVPGFQPTVATCVSDDGMIVGGTAGTFFSGLTAFIWTQDGGMQTADDYVTGLGVTLPPGVTLTGISDMTRDGRKIVGWASTGPFTDSAFIFENPKECGWSSFGLYASPANNVSLTGGGDVNVGGTFEVTTSNAQGFLVATLTSLGQLDFPFLGGTGLVNPLSLVGGVLGGTPVGGEFTSNVPIPANPGLAGAKAYFQSFSQDAGQPAGWGLSNGLELHICP